MRFAAGWSNRRDSRVHDALDVHNVVGCPTTAEAAETMNEAESGTQTTAMLALALVCLVVGEIGEIASETCAGSLSEE
jgi:hypothetical protein